MEDWVIKGLDLVLITQGARMLLWGFQASLNIQAGFILKSHAFDDGLSVHGVELRLAIMEVVKQRNKL